MPGNRWTQIWWLVSGWNRRMLRPWPMVFCWWAWWQDLMSARYWAKYTHGPASIPWQDLKIRYFMVFLYFGIFTNLLQAFVDTVDTHKVRKCLPDQTRHAEGIHLMWRYSTVAAQVDHALLYPWWIKPSFFASDWKTGSSWPPSIFTLPMQLKHSQSLAHLVYLVPSSMSCFTGWHSKYLKLAWRLVRAFVYWCASRWPSHHAAKANANHRCWNQR